MNMDINISTSIANIILGILGYIGLVAFLYLIAVIGMGGSTRNSDR